MYDATGVKVQKKVTEGTTKARTDYLGGYQYLNNVLQFFPTAEGYVQYSPVPGGALYEYIYNYTDHLGNVRLSYKRNPISLNGSLAIIEENNYYPFRLKHQGYNSIHQSDSYEYKYNGKELQTELNLNIYDYHARMYDPVIGRMLQIDPHSINWTPISPYNYTLNNPVNFVDPDGKDARIIFNIDKKGNLTITIQTTVNLYGKNSSSELALKLNQIAEKNLNSSSYKQDDGSLVNVKFDITYKHHESEESAKEAIENNGGDNMMNIDNDLRDSDMGNFPIRGRVEDESNSYGTTISGGRESNYRGYGYYEFGIFHETFHFFGFDEQYKENTFTGYSSNNGFTSDVLGRGEDLYYDENTKSRTKGMNINKSHHKVIGQFLIQNNPYESKNGGTRVYQSGSTTSNLKYVEP